MSGNYVMAAGGIDDVVGSRANINYAAGSCGVMIRSRDKRNQRFRRATQQSAPRDHGDEPLRILVRALAGQAACERFEREGSAERETPLEVTVQ
jgi:hypothetical protein